MNQTYNNVRDVLLRLPVLLTLIIILFVLHNCNNVPTGSTGLDTDLNEDIFDPSDQNSDSSSTDPGEDTNNGNDENQDNDDEVHPPSSAEFVVYDGTNMKPKPAALAQAGLKPIEIVYSTRLFNGKNAQVLRRERSTVLPDKEDVIEQAKLAARINKNIAVIDIEHWELNPQKGYSIAEIEQGIDNYITVLKWFKEAAPNTKFGYYGNVPIRDYWDIIEGENSSAYKGWMNRNDRLSPLASEVDVLFPSLYTFYADRDRWVDYAVGMIKEAKRYNRDKPVIVFLWPQYHMSNASLGNQKIEAEFWKLQLETVRKHADGIVLWAGGNFNWNSNDPWWQVTKDFMEDLK